MCMSSVGSVLVDFYEPAAAGGKTWYQTVERGCGKSQCGRYGRAAHWKAVQKSVRNREAVSREHAV